MLKIDFNNNSRIGVDVSEVVKHNQEKWTSLFYDLVRYAVKLYSKIQLINTYFYISHDKMVSMFDIVKKEWHGHYMFNSKILELLRNEKSDHILNYNVAIYLKSSEIRYIDKIKINKDEIFQVMPEQI